jgi:tetraacyldisaccharide 4'-kinase
MVYRLAVQVRNALFVLGWSKSVRLPRPVVSVGNLTVGGTGKTPTCIWLAQELKSRGYKVGILSRGYRREDTTPAMLIPNGDHTLSKKVDEELLRTGDEPFMMARLYGQTVAVSKDRGQAAAELLRKTDIDVLILDDGFQHRQIKRDIDLLLLGSDSSGWVLPAGPFREPRRNLRRANYFLVTGDNERWRSLVPAKLANAAFAASLQPINLICWEQNRWKEFPLNLLYRSKILTVTGIADPRGLYQIIHQWEGEIIDTLEFPDHHSYTARDWQQINRMARLVDLIITTEKDILKLVRFPFAKDRLLALRVAMTVENGAALISTIVDKLEQMRHPH